MQKNRTANPDAGTVESLAAELVALGLLTQRQASQLMKRQTGFVLGKYRLLTPVGKGGMGHVFEARDGKSGAIVAIKVMSRRLTGNQTLVSRFRREIRASAQLSSPHIVRTLDASRVGKVDFMVMGFVNGDQLDRITSRSSQRPKRPAKTVVPVTRPFLNLTRSHRNRRQPYRSLRSRVASCRLFFPVFSHRKNSANG